jgi:cytochrome c peroxidase
MKRILRLFLFIGSGTFLIYTLSALRSDLPEPTGLTRYCLTQFLTDSREFATTTQELKRAIAAMSETDTNSIVIAKNALFHCRNAYKKIEYFMEYFYEYPVNLYNRAPVHEIEEPYMEYQSPVGLQVIEDLLFGDNVYAQRKALLDQAAVIQSTAADIPATAYGLNVTEEQLVESINLELIRIMVLGISGYDAPVLQSGISEAGTALQAMNKVLQWKQAHGAFDSNADSAINYLNQAIAFISVDTNFNRFDRLSLLCNYLLPAQRNLNLYFRRQYPAIGENGVYNYASEHLFKADALRLEKFDRYAYTDTAQDLVALGKMLFHENRLSGNNKRSCATCHQPEKYFTDGLKGSITIDEKGATRRNAPSLLYSGYQYGQFLDARDSSLVKQIFTVLQNPDEMHSQLLDIEHKLDNKTYRLLFRKAFKEPKKGMSVLKAARAIAAYERTLNPFNSLFDQYISGNHNALNAMQKEGFNLFMGKALCGTCHFAPIFNGALPPLYNRTELEVLGTPLNGSLDHPLMDVDSGRFNVFKIEFYQFAFKTPTVRNASETAPYMHNGSFKTLDDLIEFYNQGGAAGIGLDIPSQTLSPRKLNLSRQEIAALKSFMLALKDSL